MSSCPICSGSTKVRDSKERHALLQDGSRKSYMLRRLICTSCGKLHTELPSCMLPFKHYEASVIETTIDHSRIDCPADDSTISRWVATFKRTGSQMEGALRALRTQKTKKHISFFNRKSLLQELRELGPGWLSFVHETLINSGIWSHTQFACCP